MCSAYALAISTTGMEDLHLPLPFSPQLDDEQKNDRRFSGRFQPLK